MNIFKEPISHVNWKKILFGIGISIITTIVLVAAMSGVMTGHVIEEKLLIACTLLIVLFSSFLGAGMAGKDGKGTPQIIVAAAYFAILISSNMILFEGSLSRVPATLTAVILGGTGSWMVLYKKKRKPQYKKRKIRNR